jgi:spore coat protein A, manganese oxidase
MESRRTFIRWTSAGAFGLFLSRQFGGVARLLAQALPGGTLDPSVIQKFASPLLIPPAMPRAGKITTKGGKNIDRYEIAVRQCQQQILPPPWPLTTVWGYGPKTAQNGPVIFNAPSLTIEAKHRTPLRITWFNELMDANGNYLPHLLPVDPTLHWANPPGGADGRDTRPHFEWTPGPYTGPVPMVAHLHGAAGVGDASDGYAEAWFLPPAGNLPGTYATVGTWYEFFRNKFFALRSAGHASDVWAAGTATFEYPNSQRAATLWFHDHTLGMTRLNVYAGPAGFFIVRGGPGDAAVDSRTGQRAVLPGPAPALGDAAGVSYYEIPIAIQDRAFNHDGGLFYPDTREFFDEIAGPYIPITDVSPIWNPEFFGNAIMVNGRTWPYLDVEQRRYRFRILNGCNSRFLILDFSQIPGVEAWQIGSEGGFLAAPVNLTATAGNRLVMGPAERADMIVDFTNVPMGAYVLANAGPDEPFGGGVPGVDFEVADPETTGQIMQFNVGSAFTADATTPPQFLVLPPIVPLPGGAVTAPRTAGAHVHGFRGCSSRDAARHDRRRSEHRRRTVDVAPLGRRDHRKPGGRRHGGLGVLQRNRRRASDAHPRGALPGRRSPGHRGR